MLDKFMNKVIIYDKKIVAAYNYYDDNQDYYLRTYLLVRTRPLK